MYFFNFNFIFLNDEYLSFSLKITDISNVFDENVKIKKKTGFGWIISKNQISIGAPNMVWILMPDDISG